jgi:tRNA threonylcarbamoyladenosine biosynthesis protein TsaE
VSVVASTAGVEATRGLAGALASRARPSDLVLLAGELGAGKTAFAQGFARGLGVEEPVTSPTFTLVRTYEGGRLPLHHIDVYRLDRLQEAIDLGLPEMLDSAAVTLIEWGDVVAPALPSDFLEVRLAYGDEPEQRRLALHAQGPEWKARRPELEAAVAPWGGPPPC